MIMHLLHRNIEKKVIRLLKLFPIVALIGARQCGKTVLAKKLKPTWQYIDLENPNDYNAIAHDPVTFFEQFSENIILDEAQRYPKLFEVLRGVIDANRNIKGRFILTGSSAPELLSQISESLSGRIGIVEIGTLKANEFYRKPLSKFYDLFKTNLEIEGFDALKTQPLTNQQMRNVWISGGYPEPVAYNDNQDYQLWMENYVNTYINRDIAALFPGLNKIKYQRFISMLASLSGTIVNKSEVGRALEFNESTAREYLHIAEHTFLWRELPSYEKSPIKSIVKMPKGHIRDSGLLHHFLNINSAEMLLKNPHVGMSFEGFVIEEILKGLKSTLATNWHASYYRTRGGAEVDLILHGSFGVLPVEIKFGSQIHPKQLKHLTHFINENNAPFGIIINQAPRKMWLSKNILQLPIGWL